MLCEGAGYESNLTEFYLAVIDAQKANAMQDPNQSSDWYEESYKILNKNYVKISKKQNKENEESILQKFKDLLK